MVFFISLYKPPLNLSDYFKRKHYDLLDTDLTAGYSVVGVATADELSF